MNKKQLILLEAKRLFGQYGYLGFTLKQLSQACSMTSPALYYFFASKAELFRDCLLSEMEARKDVLDRCIAQSNTVADFASALTYEAIAVCDETAFRTGDALQEIIHLPEEMQQTLRAAADACLYEPVEAFLQQVLPVTPADLPHRLLAIFLINMATFASTHSNTFSHEQIATLFQHVVHGLEVDQIGQRE